MEQTKKFITVTFHRSWTSLVHMFDFLGGATMLTLTTVRAIFKKPFYVHLLVEQCYNLGVRSCSIVFITALSTGFVMSLQFGYGLERFGGKLYVPKVVGLSIMRELGP